MLSPKGKLCFRLVGGSLHRTKHAKAAGGAAGSDGEGALGGGAVMPRPRVSQSGAQGKGAPAARSIHPPFPHRAAYLGPSGQSCRVRGGNNTHLPRPLGSGPCQPGCAVSPAGTTFVAGRRCHFLLLARRSGFRLERYGSASRVKWPRYSGRCARWDSALAPRRGWMDGFPPPRLAMGASPRERNVQPQLCHGT